MTVGELLEEIEKCRREYGDDFLDWEVYTEQISRVDREWKKKRKWKNFTDSDGWEFFECAGFWTKWPEKKIFTINVNY